MPQANSTTSRPRCTSPLASESDLAVLVGDDARRARPRAALTSSRKAKRTLVRRLSDDCDHSSNAASPLRTAASTSLRAGQQHLGLLLAGRRVPHRGGAGRGACGGGAVDPVLDGPHGRSSLPSGCAGRCGGGAVVARNERRRTAGALHREGPVWSGAEPGRGRGPEPSDRCGSGAVLVTRVTSHRSSRPRQRQYFVLTFSQRWRRGMATARLRRWRRGSAGGRCWRARRRAAPRPRRPGVGPGWCPAPGRTTRRSRPSSSEPTMAARSTSPWPSGRYIPCRTASV